MNLKKRLPGLLSLAALLLWIGLLPGQEMKKGTFTKVELKDKPLVLGAGEQYSFEKLEIKAEWKEKGTGNYFDQATGLDWLQNASFLSVQDWTELELRDTGWLEKEGAFERKFESFYSQKKLQPVRAGAPAEWMKGDLVVKLEVLDAQAAVVSTLWFRFNPDDTLMTAEEIKREVKYEIKGVSDTTNALGSAHETKVEGKVENKKPVQKFTAPNTVGNYTFQATFLQADSVTVIGSGTVPFKVLTQGEIQATTGLKVLIDLDQQDYSPGATLTATVSLTGLAGNPITNIHDDFIKKLEFWLSGPNKDYQALVLENKVVNEMAWTVADSTLPFVYKFTLPANLKPGTYSFAAWAERRWEKEYATTLRADFTVGGVTTIAQVRCSNCHVSDVVPKFEMGTDIGTTCLTCHNDQFLVGGGPWSLFGHKKHFEKGVVMRSCSSCHNFDVATEASWATCTSCHGNKAGGELISPAPPVWHNPAMDCSTPTCHGPGAEHSPDIVHERGEILVIEDVPNDQGKQVEIVWKKFPAENDVANAVVKYATWRRSEIPVTGKTGGELSKLEADQTTAQVILEGGVAWTFAGETPAAGLDVYGAVVPTLFDSTVTDGMHWTVFFVSGHTEFGNLVYKTEPDSGYSVDNLAPEAPATLLAKETDSGVELSWDDPVDTDFKFFSVYRATAPNVPLVEANRLATTTETTLLDSQVETGQTYYYTVVATDFSGNVGAPAEEIVLLVTGVEEGIAEGIPTKYDLAQNYPNPFNPSTTINFNLKASGHVALIIYNIVGDEVMRVVDQEMKAGYHKAVINGAELTSGVYFYKLQANEFVALKKMVLTK